MFLKVRALGAGWRYRKVGFVDDGPETTVDVGGTPIRCYPMKMCARLTDAD